MREGETGAMNSKLHSVVLVHQRTTERMHGQVHTACKARESSHVSRHHKAAVGTLC